MKKYQLVIFGGCQTLEISFKAAFNGDLTFSCCVFLCTEHVTPKLLLLFLFNVFLAIYTGQFILSVVLSFFLSFFSCSFIFFEHVCLF